MSSMWSGLSLESPLSTPQWSKWTRQTIEMLWVWPAGSPMAELPYTSAVRKRDGIDVSAGRSIHSSTSEPIEAPLCVYVRESINGETKRLLVRHWRWSLNDAYRLGRRISVVSNYHNIACRQRNRNRGKLWASAVCNHKRASHCCHLLDQSEPQRSYTCHWMAYW